MDWKHVGGWSWRFEFKPQDMWVGVFWRLDRPGGFIAESLDVWVCVIPMVPLHIMRERTAL
jgi:hypothetical protein